MKSEQGTVTHRLKSVLRPAEASDTVCCAEKREVPAGLVVCAPQEVDLLKAMNEAGEPGGEAGGFELAVALTGTWASRELEVTEARLQEMLSTFQAEGRPVLFDVDHMSVWGESSRAAGWGKSMRIQDGKLIVEMEPTAYGKGLIMGGEYKYLSPTFQTVRSDRVTGQKIMSWRLHSVALTNVPFLHELPAIKNNENEDGGSGMDELLKILGATDEASAIERVKAMQADQEKANGTIAELQTALNDQEVEKALAEGKILPAQKELARKLLCQDRALFDEFVGTQVPKTLGKEVKVENAEGDGLDPFQGVTSFGDLLKNGELRAQMEKDQPKRYNELYMRWMREGK